MFDAIKPLLDSGLINEDVSKELNEAWESKLTEAREIVRAELQVLIDYSMNAFF